MTTLWEKRSVPPEPAAPAAARCTADNVAAREDLEGLPVELESDGVIVERFRDLRPPVWLFGAGHVGRALMLALAPLPFEVTWIDERDGVFPAAVPANVRPLRSADAAAEVARAPADARIVVMTHNHPLDLAIVPCRARGRTVRLRGAHRIRPASAPGSRGGSVRPASRRPASRSSCARSGCRPSARSTRRPSRPGSRPAPGARRPVTRPRQHGPGRAPDLRPGGSSAAVPALGAPGQSMPRKFMSERASPGSIR